MNTRRICGAAWLIAFGCLAPSCTDPRRSTDSGFILLEDTPSPNLEFRLLVYHYDTGAFGYSRAWWAVTPLRFEGLDLRRYELPDGYMGVGWSPESELLVKTWKPYYYPEHTRSLSTGDLFQGARVVVAGAYEDEKSDAKAQ